MNTRLLIANEDDFDRINSPDCVWADLVGGDYGVFEISGIVGEDWAYVYGDCDGLPTVSVILKDIEPVPSNYDEYLKNIGKGFVAKFIMPWLTNRVNEGFTCVPGDCDRDDLNLPRKFRKAFGAQGMYKAYIRGCKLESCPDDDARGEIY